MKIINGIWNIGKNQEGAATVIFAIIVVALFGMSSLALDLGGAYIQTSKLQNALDSAALAAIQELPAMDTMDQSWQNAVTIGTQYATANGLDSVDFEPIMKGGRISGIKAQGTAEIEYTLASVIGFDSGQVNRNASAEIQVVDGMSGLVPLSATTESMDNLLLDSEDDTIYLKGGPQDKEFFGDAGGWRGFWSVEKGGFNVDGYSDMVRVGIKPVKIVDGVKTNATDELYTNRMIGHESCTVENYETDCPNAPNCPRIITIPIVEVLSNQDLAVRGFASFYLEPAEIESNQIKTISATYIDTIVVSGEASGGTASDYGVYVWKLTK